MGRTAYEGIAGAMTTSTDHPFAPILNAARKVVFSRTRSYRLDLVSSTASSSGIVELRYRRHR